MDQKLRARYNARARIVKALAHPTRLFIVDELSKRERCVRELTAMVGADISTVSQHLSLLKTAGIEPSSGRWPRIHELRHTFAVRALEASPTGRQRIGQHMLALATYLGHVNINATYWYLETTPELLLDIAVVAEDFVQGGRQ